MNSSRKIHIQENYKNFSPPPWVHKSISRLIDGVPPRYVKGLYSIVLTNVDGLNHGRRRQRTVSRKRKVSVIDCQGLYHHAWQGKPAVIELFIDKIIYRWPALILEAQLFQDMLFAEVLYHELGHHIHKTSAPENREREQLAEDWARSLGRFYFRKRHKWIKPLGLVLNPMVALFMNIARSMKRKKRKSANLF